MLSATVWLVFSSMLYSLRLTDRGSFPKPLTAKQEPIAGLYVAGVDNGSLYASPYYENEGASIGVAFTSGIVAAKYMAEYIKA